jgi:ATP-dependent DNA helicase RecG
LKQKQVILSGRRQFTENETQRKIVELMLANPKISKDSIAQQISLTTRGVQKSINGLKTAGFVERIGAAKGRHWVVKLSE